MAGNRSALNYHNSNPGSDLDRFLTPKGAVGPGYTSDERLFWREGEGRASGSNIALR
jgi:hypothetical protein